MSFRRFAALSGLSALLLIVALVLSSCAPAVMAAPSPAGEAPPRTITVVGRGEVKAKPDIARANIGVEVTAATVAEAMADAKARMAAVLKALKEFGVSEKDIQTSNFSISFERLAPEYPLPVSAGGSEPKAQGAEEGSPAGIYHVSNMVEVTIRNLDNVGDVLDAVIEAGANNMWGIYFGLDDTSALEAQAREAAVADARARAESLARLHGVNVGDVIAISEVVGNLPVPYYGEGPVMKGYSGGGAAVEPGEVTFSTQIQVVYAIR